MAISILPGRFLCLFIPEFNTDTPIILCVYYSVTHQMKKIHSFSLSLVEPNSSTMLVCLTEVPLWLLPWSSTSWVVPWVPFFPLTPSSSFAILSCTFCLFLVLIEYEQKIRTNNKIPFYSIFRVLLFCILCVISNNYVTMNDMLCTKHKRLGTFPISYVGEIWWYQLLL